MVCMPLHAPPTDPAAHAAFVHGTTDPVTRTFRSVKRVWPHFRGAVDRQGQHLHPIVLIARCLLLVVTMLDRGQWAGPAFEPSIVEPIKEWADVSRARDLWRSMTKQQWQGPCMERLKPKLNNWLNHDGPPDAMVVSTRTKRRNGKELPYYTMIRLGIDAQGSRVSIDVHRLVCWLERGPPPTPEQSEAMHMCNNAACINPYHMRWGTMEENLGRA